MRPSTKPDRRVPILLPLVAAGLVWMLPGWAGAQMFRTLHNFSEYIPNDAFGYEPIGALVLSGDTLYGTTHSGGTAGGVIFAIRSNGTGLSRLYSVGTGSEGYPPSTGLVLSGSVLYGTSPGGGGSGAGAVFSISTDGTGFSVLYSFTALDNTVVPNVNSDGASPNGPLVLSGNILYGTALWGGGVGSGTVFSVQTNGTGFTTLYTFSQVSSLVWPIYNTDGARPAAGLLLASNVLYGTTLVGGSGGVGTVFSLNTDGTGFTTLHSFTALSAPSNLSGTNSDGANPQATLVLSSNVLYGVAAWGGTNGNGTIFAINTDGTGFHTLHTFSAFTGYNYASRGEGTNADGQTPIGLVVSGDTLYGIAGSGGGSGYGSVFMLKTDGTGFRGLHYFTPVNPSNNVNTDGDVPSSLILSGNTLYGTTFNGGSGGGGTIFTITLPVPQLAMAAAGTNIVLTWPTNLAGFDYTGYALQSTTNLGPTAVWNTNFPPPVIVNGQNTVTNPVSATQQFFRLVQ